MEMGSVIVEKGKKVLTMAKPELSPCEYGEERKDNDVEDISELDAASTTAERRMIKYG